MSNDTQTLEQSQKLSELTSLLADSPAKTSVLPACKQESTANEADCGENLLGSLGYFSPGSCSLKTSQASLLTNQCDEYLDSFPRSGSMQNGNVFQRPPLVPLTYATGFGYLPTPDKSIGALRGGDMMRADAQTCFQKEFVGSRSSGAKIGSSLRWCPEFIREALRTGGYVNPSWLAVLMGFPEDWWILPTEHSETPLSPKLPNGLADE